MVATTSDCLDRLCDIAWEQTGSTAWNVLYLLPFLKYEHSETLASILVTRSSGEPFCGGVAWLAGELGVASDDMVAILRRTVTALPEGAGSSPGAWWEAGFALEKLGQLPPQARQFSRQGEPVVAFLAEHLPPGATLDNAIAGLRRALEATDREAARICQCDIVTVVKHENEGGRERCIAELLPLVDFVNDTLGRRVYFLVWLCGHLKIHEHLTDILKATDHPLSSVRNCASEALGKIGVSTDEVIKSLVKGLSDSYYRTRFHAAWSLGQIKATSVIDALAEAMRDEDVRDVREAMMEIHGDLVALRTAPQP
jgi:hypothetical protein